MSVKGAQALVGFDLPLYIDELVQDRSNSNVLAMELLQSCAKPSIYMYHIWTWLEKAIFVLSCAEAWKFQEN